MSYKTLLNNVNINVEEASKSIYPIASNTSRRISVEFDPTNFVITVYSAFAGFFFRCDQL